MRVVVRRSFSGVTEDRRGADLIEPAVRQLSLYKRFGWRAPVRAQLRWRSSDEGAKLSKANGAPALATGDPPGFGRALRF